MTGIHLHGQDYQWRGSLSRSSEVFLRRGLLERATAALVLLTTLVMQEQMTAQATRGGLSGAGGQLRLAGPLVAKVDRAGNARQRSFYVSPAGNDQFPGTSPRPFRSLSRARDAVRKSNRHMSGSITVYLAAGTYRLAEPLQLDARDSGNNGHTVVWQSAPGATAVISGGVRVSGWTLSDSSKNMWAADVPANLRTRQLYINGVRAQMASGPPPPGLVRTATGYATASPVMAQWRNPSQIAFVYTSQLGLMVEPICPVAAITPTSITMAQPCWANSTRRHRELVGYGTLGAPASVQNAYELLDQPGEFYLDDSRHTLYYIPRPGEDMARADAELPVLQTLVAGTGTPSAPLHDIAFVNLQFSYATWLQPSTPEGFSEIQANYTITGARGYATQGLCHVLKHGHGTCPYGAWTKEPGNVELGYDRNVSFANDRFVHLGAAGLNLDDGSQHVTVRGSVFTDISGNGIEVGSVDLPKATRDRQTRAITVTDNHVYGLPVEYHGGVGILVGYVANSSISHNQLDHLPYSGISMGWGGWPDKIGQVSVANYSHDNAIAHNLIYDYMEMLADGGGIYTQGITGPSLTRGQKVIGNVIHDQLSWSYALHSDDGASNIVYSRNVLYDNNYDYCCNHTDYGAEDGGYDPQTIRGNYWQQGDPNSSASRVVEAGNTIIAGPRQAPSSILSIAGIRPRYRANLRWHAAGSSAPTPPNQVTALYAFGGKAYVTWRPSLPQGNEPIKSYRVVACREDRSAYPLSCDRPATVVSVSETTYRHLGYAVLGGLRNGVHYTFTVAATSRAARSTPSVPSPEVAVRTRGPEVPGGPRNIQVRRARNAVSLSWYAPRSTHCSGRWYSRVCRRPVLGYLVTVSTGRKYTVTGLSHLIVSNASGRTVRVIGGLSGRARYTFSFAALSPVGVGAWVTSPPVTLLSRSGGRAPTPTHGNWAVRGGHLR